MTTKILTILLLACTVCCNAQATQVEVHDPVLAKEGGFYYAFSTGPGITIYRSQDRENWRRVGRVFETEPQWARDVAPGFNGHLWAPDIFEKDGRYYLFYSVSAFGKNTSGMGVAVSETLDPESPDYGWKDQGMVLQSIPNRDHWNAIDPAIVEDGDGNYWMSFGSFWEGLKLVRLDPSLTRLAEPQEWHSLAKRPNDPNAPDDSAGTGAIEAPYIFRKGDWYYLFVSFDLCCRQENSTYNVRVGRSKSVTGPYVDRDGVPLLQGGGTLVLEGNERWTAVGHNSAYMIDGQDWLVLHAYETADNHLQKLRILPIAWDDGWPVVDPADLDRLTTTLIED
jgi:arabinan endo-1,5-alpha-L-arabinosidase